MANSLTADSQKLVWCGKLCALLLNDGTNALLWFLKENLPRKQCEEPDLGKLLKKKENRNLFLELCKEPCPVINLEMFDVLYGEDEVEVDEKNLEIYLIFVLIRYLSKLKHWSWKWWDEDPQDHQISPLFDVIRIFRFKQRMEGMVHNYEITKDIFDASWNYVTSVLDRLHSYKISSRRWINDVTRFQIKDSDVTAYSELIEIMKWQTLDLKRRQDLYMCLKENRKNKSRPFSQSWSDFISNFGQMRSAGLSRIDRPKLAPSLNTSKAHLATLYKTKSEAKELHGHYSSPIADGLMQKHGKKNKDIKVQSGNLSSKELKTLNRTNNDVFIEGFQDSQLGFGKTARALRHHYIKKDFEIAPNPVEPDYRIHMDEVVINVEKIASSADTCNLFCGEIPLERLESEHLTSWREILLAPSPLRFMLSGKRSSGKTTILKKISYEWATSNSTQLINYQLVFCLELGLVQIREPFTSLSECIIEQCLPGYTVDEVEDLFHHCQGDGILLLLDDLEHMPDASSDVMSEISEVICGKRWPKCSVVLTTNFTKSFNDREQEKMYRNAFFLFNRSLHTFGRFNTVGFTTHDVITHARHYFACDESSPMAYRKLLNFCRVFQRDVYKGVISSPAVIFLLSYLWKFKINSDSGLSPLQFPETLSESVAPFFKGSIFSDKNSSFWDSVLGQTLNGRSGGIYNSLPSNLLDEMVRRGILREASRKASLFRFSHHLFEEYCAAYWLSKTSTDKVEILLKNHVVSLHDVIRLRNFLPMCCSFGKQLADSIITLMSDLTVASIEQGGLTNGDDLLEASKHLTLQCFYELKDVTGRSFLSFESEQIGLKNVNKGGSELRLRAMNLLSHRSKQALLFLTRQSHPALTKSGTVFFFTDHTSFWIRSIHLSNLRGEQMSFVTSILQNLPFLEVAKLDNLSKLKNKDVVDLCRGLRYSAEDRSALHSLTFTEKLNSTFDTTQITSYTAVGELLNDLLYLEELCLTLPSLQLFFSLFENTSVVVPLTIINLSGFGLVAQLCENLAKLLKRLVFVQKLLLSSNTLGDGFASISRQLFHLRFIKEIDISKTYLTPASVGGFADSLKRLPTLESLNLSGNHLQEEASTTKLLATIGVLPALKFFDMSDNCLGESGVCVLAKSLNINGQIQVLKLNRVQMGPVALSSLKFHLRNCSNLSVLSLAGNYFSSTLLDFLQILKPISENSDDGLMNLADLDMSGIGSNFRISVQPESITTFLDSIKKHQKLRSLSLRNIFIEKAYLTLLLEGCERHSSLKEIRLSKNLLNLDEKQTSIWRCLKLM